MIDCPYGSIDYQRDGNNVERNRECEFQGESKSWSTDGFALSLLRRPQLLRQKHQPVSHQRTQQRFNWWVITRFSLCGTDHGLVALSPSLLLLLAPERPTALLNSISKTELMPATLQRMHTAHSLQQFPFGRMNPCLPVEDPAWQGIILSQQSQMVMDQC